MTSTSLFFDIFGRDQGVGKVFDDIGSKGKTLGGALKGVGMAMGAGLVGLGAAVVKTGLGELTDWSAGAAQLQAGIKSTNNAAHTTVDGMEALASSIQDYSGQTDDSIVSAENLLLTFTNIKNSGPNKIFDETTKAAADMAAKLGTDAAPQAMLLGKALNDPAKGLTYLTRAGVSFTAGQRESIKAMQASGNIMGAQKLILGEVTKEFGGAAKAAGNSLPGELKKSKRAFEDTSQSLTQALLPALTAGAKALTGFAKWAGQNQPLVKTLAVVVGVLAAAFVVLSAAMAVAASPFILIGMGIALLIAGLVLAYNKVGWFRDGVNTAVKIIGAVFTGLWNDAVVPAFNGIKGAIEHVVNFVTGTVVPGFQKAAGWISDSITGAIKGFNQFRDGVQSAIGKAIDFVTGIPGKITDALSDAGSWLVKTGEDVINGLINGIGNVIGNVEKTITDGIGGAIDGVKNFLGIHSPSTVMAEIGGNMGQGLVNGIDNMRANVHRSVNALVPALDMAGGSISAAAVGRQIGSTGTGMAGGRPMTMTGTLVMDSGEVLGTFRGIAVQEVNKGISKANDDLGRRPTR